MFYLNLKIFEQPRRQSLNTDLLYGCSLVDPPITKSTSFTIVTRKEIVWKRHDFFCLCYVPILTSTQSFPKGTKSSGSFNNISKFKHKVLEDISFKPRLCFKISQGITE